MERLPEWKRIVIKVGSSLVAARDEKGRPCFLERIAAFINVCRAANKDVVLVSSGAVATGLSFLPKPLSDRGGLTQKQALAALGQSRLIAIWQEALATPCAQVLLTYDDLRNRKRFVNAKHTLRTLLDWGTLPIVNENDSVAVDELKVGDNDNLAAHVAALVEADLLCIFSDVNGLYDGNPRTNPDARLLSRVDAIDTSIYALAGGAGSSVGTGGMFTKIQAAEKAMESGIHTVIVSGAGGAAAASLLAGICPGTWFPARERLKAKKHWLRYALPTEGELVVDAGAARALLTRGASLLPSGLDTVRGDFQRGAAVCIRGPDNRQLGKGVVQYSAESLRKICGCRGEEVAGILGFFYGHSLVHREDLVLTHSTPGQFTKVTGRN